MRLESLDFIDGEFVAQMSGLPGQTARLTDCTLIGLRATVQRLIDFDRASQQHFLESFRSLTARDNAPSRPQPLAPQRECSSIMGS